MISYKEFFLENSSALALSQASSKDLGMFNSVARLPTSEPYGFWVDRHGNFKVVGNEGHDESARQILTSAGIRLNPQLSVYDFLMKAGWLRIVLSRQIVFHESFPGNFPTNPQKKFMSFIKDFYEMKMIAEG